MKEATVQLPAGAMCGNVQVSGFSLHTDEPLAAGGTGCGPDPYDYLLSALGACTVLTLRLYAQRKQWPLEGVSVHLSHHKLHASDCTYCENEPAPKLDQILRQITLEGPLSEDQRARLFDIAQRCPVHNTLTQGVEVRSELIPAA